MLEYNFNQSLREFILLKTKEKSNFDIAIANNQESTWLISCNTC